MRGKKIGLSARGTEDPAVKKESPHVPAKKPPKVPAKKPPKVPPGKPPQRVPPRGPPLHAMLRMAQGVYKITAGDKIIDRSEVPILKMDLKEKKIV